MLFNFIRFFPLLLSFSVFASVPELIGSSANNIAIGNQAQIGKSQAQNNFYAGSLLTLNEKLSFSFNLFYIDPNFYPIKNVVTENTLNTDDGVEKTGNVDTDLPSTTMMSGHLSVPLFKEKGPVLGLSFFAPVDKLTETSTGDPYQPEYVMYRSRATRPLFLFNLAQKFNHWSFALGAYSGFQAQGETFFVARTSGDSTPSSGKFKFNVKPTWSAIASVHYHQNNHITYFSWQQAMKSKFSTEASGYTPVGGGSFPFDLTMNSLMYYDPMILRLGHIQDFSWLKLYTSLEYQQWDQYQSPKLSLHDEGGVIVGSEDYEKLKLKNIFIPKVGIEKSLNQTWTVRGGYFYRPTPIKRSSYKTGNSLDANVHAISAGVGYNLTLFGSTAELSFSYQLQYLEPYKVSKSDNQEDGSPGHKIGAPNYRVGGNISSIVAGLSWNINE